MRFTQAPPQRFKIDDSGSRDVAAGLVDGGLCIACGSLTNSECRQDARLHTV
jgi:hypothetical protein